MILKFILRRLIVNNTQKFHIWEIPHSFYTTQKWLPMMEEAVNKVLYNYSDGIMPILKSEYWEYRQDLANAA
ncbi:hypothetical protein JQC76_09320 [Elizabethkingia anophelis]|uniref:hypothetical protein n=1 Tax=Elizabethkingia anophelis TaxID=1117645 RepID=UPI00193C77F8|nr:hypothetical protein [Elizabethkingia anophelis]QRI48304.1 hypothetical protein JQC76_09320 [Elizabethkingia anophelis]